MRNTRVEFHQIELVRARRSDLYWNCFYLALTVALTAFALWGYLDTAAFLRNN